MNCFVIGGTGTVGALVVGRLASLGHRVHVATRDPARIGALPEGGRAVAFQLERVSAADFAGVDRVFCMVPRGVALSRDQEASLVSALSGARVTRVVLMTGLGVDRALGSPLHRLEGALRQSGLAHAIVRPNYIFQNLCAGVLREGIVRRDEIAVPVGDGLISFVDARDVADVAAAALLDDRTGDPAFDLTGPAAVSHGDLATAIGRAVGRAIRYRPLSDDEARVELAAAGMPSHAIEARLGFLALARRGLFASVSTDVERVLGRPPRGLASFAADHVLSWSKETP